jgi:hypothetical protein
VNFIESTDKLHQMDADLDALLQLIDPETRAELNKCSKVVVFLYLIEAFRWQAPQRERIALSTLTAYDVYHFTRFRLEDLKKIRRLLRIPDRFSTRSNTPLSGDEALFLFLTRLAFPWRLKTLELLFGHARSTISEGTNWILWYIYKHWDFLLDDFASPLATSHLSDDRLALFARKVHAKGAPLAACWGFIDCTIRKICRPKKYQRECYNGYKHIHALKYSAVKCPDGLIYHLYGPFEGRRNDNSLLAHSNLLDRLRTHAPQFYIYGDPAYSIHSVLLSPFDNAKLTPEEQEFNKRMSAVREVVEWGFADVIRLWGALEWVPTQRMFNSAVGIQYRVAVLLTNMHICLYGSETSWYFKCCPPKLEEATFCFSERRVVIQVDQTATRHLTNNNVPSGC